jgi:large subunit ribosomal protein L10
MAGSAVGSARREKERVVGDVADRLGRAASVVIVNYRGLKVSEDFELRRRLRAARVDYRIVKNTLVSLATRQAGVDDVDELLRGPTAIAFSMEDPTAGPRELLAFAKDHQSLEFKGGLLGGRVIAASGVTALADLPSREVLLARVAGALASPLVATATVLGAPMRGLAALTLALAQQRQERGGPAAAEGSA